MMNAAQQHACSLVVAHGRNVFVTGSGGVGKTFWIKRVVHSLREKWSAEQVVLAAPTGVAATAIGGVTLHSALGVGVPQTYGDFRSRCAYRQNRTRICKWRTLIVDEVSMVSGEFLEQMDAALKSVRRDARPFGGLQVVFVGDFHQLPPISPNRPAGGAEAMGNYGFAFQAPAWLGAGLLNVVFEHPFRQAGDLRFAGLLGKIRCGDEETAAEALAALAAECRNGHAFADADGGSEEEGDADAAIRPTRIYALNADVDSINAREVKRLQSTVHLFKAHDGVAGLARKRGESEASFAEREGRYRSHDFFRSCITPAELYVSVGCQVMLTRTHSFGSGLINGSRGVVTAIADGMVHVQFQSGGLVAIGRKEITHEVLDASGSCQKVTLKRVQVPLKLAWAITVHKSQGMTLDRVVLSLKSMFASGHAYVALSRACSLSGLEILDRPDDPAQLLAWAKDLVKVDSLVLRFYRGLVRHAPGDALPDPPKPVDEYAFLDDEVDANADAGGVADADGNGNGNAGGGVVADAAAACWDNREWDDWMRRKAL